MPKRAFLLSPPEVEEIELALFASTNGARRTRCLAVRLYGTGHSVESIRRLTGCSRASLMNWCRRYREHGVEGLADNRAGGNRAKLSQAQIAELSERLRRYSPSDLFGFNASLGGGQLWTVADLERAVERWYGVTWESRTSYRSLFAQCGFAYQAGEKVYKCQDGRQKSVAERSPSKDAFGGKANGGLAKTEIKAGPII